MGALLAGLIAESGRGAIPAIPAIPELPSSGTTCSETPEPATGEDIAEAQNIRLMAALRYLQLPESWLGRDHGDAGLLAALDDHRLQTYLTMLEESERRELGKAPKGETARAMCKHCGPIWLGPEVAACAPIVDGWPQVLGCPWCHVRNRQAIPRPEVTCGECRHFVRDRINPDGGLGRCGAGLDPEVPYPHARRQCKSWRSA